MQRRTFLGGFSVVAGSAVHPAFAQGKPGADHGKKTSLRWASTTSITAPDPYYNYFREPAIITAQMVWDTLVYRDPVKGDYLPLLAKSWKWLNDTTIEFVLRDGVKWHDGKPLTVEDAIYTINYVADPAKKVNVQSNVNWMKSAEKTGPNTFRLSLKAPFPAAFEFLAGLVPIMPKDFYGPNGQAGAGGRLVGTGPYRINRFVPGSVMDLDRFEGYFAGSPKGKGFMKTINYRTIPEVSTQIAELLGGGIDWIWNVPADQAKRLEAHPNLTVLRSETMRISYLALNTRDMSVPNPLQNKKLREAIAYAIDRDALVKHIVGQGSSTVKSACYRTQFGCKQDVPQYNYDPAKAKRLLVEANYSPTTPLEILGYRSREWTEAIGASLENVGIKVNLTFADYNSVHTRVLENKNVHMFLADWGSYSINDVSVTLNNFFTLSGDDMAQDKTVAKWIKDASLTSDQKTRKALYDQALDRIASEVYWVPLWVHPGIYAHAKGLDFTPYPDENPRLFLTKWS